ncbi:antitoxin of toxin-antitoxin stability system [Arvimicrobium flavum]|uniref:antitoxin of toxin-antitoxin stability system n=1 Tax=Arvimicrobium flavum TaxID=3393320 RepID=UPI00237AD790|nr:antitoxin of toxin-antitoxin stability system [Mesorhizobium shangrilense]
MARIVETTVYDFAELSDPAKDKARTWFRESWVNSWDWWDSVYDDFAEICRILGITLAASPVRLMGGGLRQDPRIYFRGFSSQGDGACYEGHYAYAAHAGRQIRSYAPQDAKLHAIADALQAVQRRNFYQLAASFRHRGHYCHAYSMDFDVERDSPTRQPMTADAETAVVEALRDLAHWLYRQLLTEYEYLTSDEAVDDGIAANSYTFTETGRHFG